jgi:hypothetical protein
LSQEANNQFWSKGRAKLAEMEDAKQKWWASLTHVQKAEWLLERVNYQHVNENHLPRLALAQVHATLALTEKAKD